MLLRNNKTEVSSILTDLALTLCIRCQLNCWTQDRSSTRNRNKRICFSMLTFSLYSALCCAATYRGRFPLPCSTELMTERYGGCSSDPTPWSQAAAHFFHDRGQIRTDVGKQDLCLGAKASFAPSTKWLCFVWGFFCCCFYI